MPNTKKSADPAKALDTSAVPAKPPKTSAGPAHETLTPHLDPTVLQTAHEGLGFLTVNTDGCIVRFGIDPEEYFLDIALPNYNALFSMLLTCWQNGTHVTLTYRPAILTTARVVAAAGPPAIISATAIRVFNSEPR